MSDLLKDPQLCEMTSCDALWTRTYWDGVDAHHFCDKHFREAGDSDL